LRIGHLELFCRDVAATAAFYRDALAFSETAEQGPFLWLQSGPLEVLLRPGEPPSQAARYEEAGAGLVVYVADLGAARAELEARGVVFRGTVDTDDCLTFTDPDGRWLQLVAAL